MYIRSNLKDIKECEQWVYSFSENTSTHVIVNLHFMRRTQILDSFSCLSLAENCVGLRTDVLEKVIWYSYLKKIMTASFETLKYDENIIIFDCVALFSS